MTADPGTYDVQPEPRDREAEAHDAEDARDERTYERWADAILLRHEADAMDRVQAAHVPPSVAEFAVERLVKLERIVRVAQEWRDAELHGKGGEAGLYRLRDALDRACGLGIGQRSGAL